MNPVIFLQKHLGSKKTKIRAIGFEIEKLHDERNAIDAELDTLQDNDLINYSLECIKTIDLEIHNKHLEIEVIRNE